MTALAKSQLSPCLMHRRFFWRCGMGPSESEVH